MKKIQVYLSAIVICAVSWSCKTSTILEATFEGDAVNNPPATDLPGAPSGDVIEYHADMTPQLKVQNSTLAGSKALHFTNVSIPDVPGHQRWLSFKGIGTDLTKTIWFTHTGQNTGASQDLHIYISDGHAHVIAMMRIASNGQVALAKNIADSFTDVIGNIGSQSHTIIFTVSASTLKYNVTILTPNGPTITAENKPMITDSQLSFNNPAHPELSIQHVETPNPSHLYAIGNVLITKKKP
jgi:hypothetical protein